ncbi:MULTISPECIES: NAD(P)-dependent oxidoreductase [unclassified Ectothiorhodospira]|uniref:NAD(P)-dependent oxidoreductase n=1 Tax=unclassified Ectothiorhodospira TaxID=2684909 RepID=UPI001EE9580E|nr:MULTISPECIES: NAD(P)-dependent oxidoreductase [unclassified Ectothiorhodospira]MCG5516089.1 NAD(P)-dependent oxidoreductase [Ectothiorhodospira sp. 9100]MCG5519101.1 NAD(P)-dependent oxidoreductase [Ectothiorhodospira sp. 9905]
MTLKVGCIGLGIMGGPMAMNLLKAGHEVHVWARRLEATEVFKDAGAHVDTSPAKLARQVDVVLTNVSDTRDVEQVLVGNNGVIEGAQPGLVVVDHSTISPAATRKLAMALADRDVDMLDAPVSGGQQGAREGSLTIMVGGKAEVLERVRPVLEVVGRSITHVGDHGAGQITKACNQLIVAQTMNAVSEAIRLAEASGVDPAAMREAVLGGLAYSRVLEVHGQRMIDRSYPPGFKARLHAKDMGIVLQTAADLGLPLPGTAQAAQWINAAVGQGYGEEDSAVIAEVLRRLMPSSSVSDKEAGGRS